MFGLNCKEITANLLPVISVHWNEKFSQLIVPQSGFFILPPSQEEYAICSSVYTVQVGQYAVRSWGRELSIFICSLVR